MEADKDVAWALRYKRCTSSNRKLRDKAREFIKSIWLTLKTPSTPCSSSALAGDEDVIPDVDLLERIYEGATVRLAPNNDKSATIAFNTGVAQGSITSPQRFNIFINALLRMLTVTGQNENICHGLQIGKDQKGDNQQDENSYQFNNIGFIDDIDISIFADTPEGMQRCAGIYGLN